MSIIDLFRRSASRRQDNTRSYSLEDPNVPLNAATLGWKKPTRTGVNVTPETAMAYSAVLACVRVIAETMASVPLNTFRRLDNGGKEKARTHYSYHLVHTQPNPYMTSFSWRELMIAQVLLWGNHYSWINMAANGIIKDIWPLDPIKTHAVIDDVTGLHYETEFRGRKVSYDRAHVIHVPGMSFDGLSGKSIISWMAESIGLGIAIEEFGASFYGDGALPAGVLEHPGKLDDAAVTRIKEGWKQQYGGLSNAQSIAVLREGMTFNALSVNPVDAQALEAKRFQVSDIARGFRVPLMMLQYDTNVTTFASAEQFMLQFRQFTIQPWAVRIEQELTRKLFSPEEQKKYFAEFNLDGLLRGDFKTRQEGLKTMRQNGIINADEWREYENMNPLPDGAGKVYLNPLNMAPAGGSQTDDKGGDQ